MKEVDFPFVLYKGRVAYTLSRRETTEFPTDLSYESYLGPMGMVLPANTNELSSYHKYIFGHSPNSTEPTIINEYGEIMVLLLKDGKPILSPPRPTFNMETYIVADLTGHRDFLSGSLTYTQDLKKSCQVFRDNFAIPHGDIIIESYGDFVARVKLLMEKHYPYVVSERPIIRSKTEPVKRG